MANKIYFFRTIKEGQRNRLRPLPFQTDEAGRDVMTSLNVQAEMEVRQAYPVGTVFASEMLEDRQTGNTAFYSAGDIYPVSVKRDELLSTKHAPTDEMVDAYNVYISQHGEKLNQPGTTTTGVFAEEANAGKPLSLLDKLQRNPKYTKPTVDKDGFYVEDDTWWDLMLNIVNNVNTLFKGPAGSGKCLGKDTPILMFDGTIKKVQDIKVGELLMGPDSKPRTVLSTTTGKEELFEITPNHGEKWICNKSHILSLQRNIRKNGKLIRKDLWNVPITEWIKNHKGTKKEYKQWSSPINFKTKKIDIEPYFLGIWLGDGKKDHPTICTPDHEIIQYINEYAIRLGMKVSKYPESSKADSYSIVRKNERNTRTRSILQTKMDKYNLFYNKHIPFDFLTNNKKNRLQLLAGLLDTDGYYNKQKNEFEFSSKDEKLIKDFAYLCRSLGFRCTFRPKMINNTTYYRASVYGNLKEIPTKVERKKAHHTNQRVDPCHTGFTIKSIGEGDYYGFTINGDHLFMLGDFTVTHNTELIQLACKKLDIPCHIYDMGSMYDPISDLLGVHRMTVQGSVFDYAQFTQDIQHEGVILLDELSRATPAVNNILMPCLDSRRTLRVEMAGSKDKREIPVHPKCRFVATANIGAEYSGTNELDLALRDRFDEMDINYMPVVEEVSMLMKRFKICKADAQNIVKTAATIRNKAASGDIEFAITTRETIRAAAKVRDGWPATKAMERAFLPRYEGSKSEGSKSVVWNAILAN